MKNSVICLLLLSLCGCAEEPKAALIPLDKLPANVLQVAKETLPEVTFEQAMKRPDGGFEVRGKDKSGKIRDVEFSLDGKVIEIE